MMVEEPQSEYWINKFFGKDITYRHCFGEPNNFVFRVTFTREPAQIPISESRVLSSNWQGEVSCDNFRYWWWKGNIVPMSYAHPRDLSCSRCLATIQAYTLIGPVLNVHVSKLCGVFILLRYRLNQQFWKVIFHGCWSAEELKDLWKCCIPTTIKSTTPVHRCWSWRMIPNQSCWLLGFTVLGDQYLIHRIHEATF